ncbi:MAG TPA: PAS domain S-box protein, partial [Spirochaetes bacterium]|nr:PAS domain S-box protein [Spirochaetota bacterium]
MRKQIVLLMLMVVLLTFILASLWGFWLEDLVHHALGIHTESRDSTKRHWEYVITIITFVTLALIIPSWLLLNRDKKKTQAENTLRSSQEDLQLFWDLMNQSNDATFIIDSENGAFTDVNNKACSSLEYTRDELLNLKPTDIETAVHNESERKRFLIHIRETGSFIHEGQHKRKDGSIFPVEVSI